MEDFLINLAGALNLEESELDPQQSLEELPCWDSLGVLTTLSMLDQEYGVLLSGPQLQACRTPEDILREIRKLKEKTN